MVNLDKIVQVLLTEPQGLGAPALRRRLRTTQPTLWRALNYLRGSGRIFKEGRARATRYHAVESGLSVAALRSRRLHESVAKRLIQKPELLTTARDRLQFLRHANPYGASYHDRWAELLAGPVEPLLRELTEASERADALRRESPFTTLVPPVDRERIFKSLQQSA
jgi:hypothetical protein